MRANNDVMHNPTRAGYAEVGIQNPVNDRQTIKKLGMYRVRRKLPTFRMNVNFAFKQEKVPVGRMK